MTGFTVDDLLTLAGPASFARGAEYVKRVGDLHRSPEGIRATVAGGYPYDVLLTLDHEVGVVGQCSCPYGEEGNFCKHCVAVGLAVLHADGEPTAAPARTADVAQPVSPSDDPIRRYLWTLDPTELADRLRAQADADPALHRRLTLEASRAMGATPDLSALRFELGTTLRVRGFIPYRDSFDYATGARSMCEHLAELVDAGFAAEIVPLAKRGVELLTAALLKMDDSGGAAGDVLEEFVALHAQACALAPPDPVKLASWLSGLETDGPGWPSVRIADYAAGLGPKGLAAYRGKLERLAADAADSPETAFRRATILRLRADLAEHEGKVDELIAILAGRRHPDDYLRIARALQRAGRGAEALGWAERGLAEVPWHSSRGLADYLVREYAASGRGHDAIALRRARFDRHPSLSTFQELRHTAELVDVADWTAERGRALDLLQAAAARTGPARYSTDPGSVLVQILLDESDDAQAWRAYRSWGADHATALALAERRAAEHPADAIPIFQAEVGSLTETAKTKVYPRAAKLVSRIRDLYVRAGDEIGWAAYREELVGRNRRRTSFIAALDKRGLLPR